MKADRTLVRKIDNLARARTRVLNCQSEILQIARAQNPALVSRLARDESIISRLEVEIRTEVLNLRHLVHGQDSKLYVTYTPPSYGYDKERVDSLIEDLEDTRELSRDDIVERLYEARKPRSSSVSIRGQ